MPGDGAVEDESIVFLHGMGRTWLSMAVLGHRFRRAGYRVHLFGYSSRAASLDELSRSFLRYIEERVETPRYHLIGHSLGNVIVRNGFRPEVGARYRRGLSKLVMLAPPNGPASLASSLRDVPLYRWWTGDSGQKLADESFYRSLPVPTVDFAVIAGDRGHRIGLEAPNDGVVRVSNTKLAGMSDFVVVHHTHTFVMMAADTFELCHRFLRDGAFGASGGAPRRERG